MFVPFFKSGILTDQFGPRNNFQFRRAVTQSM